ncbi:hypothetical protein [Oceanibacterium hippocampi]|uniref:Uncharacterized protein n=1 Tax=Oceanibacterium hippocampi TaxID=745714 RepID=A0A1Y5TXK8_9PROT|nr:hypothetical protein [Oceanibacterium hippocampi]SLN73085.1 hypothetical protein OCH7691_03565 [Oceanibacterium hippocampi]
MTQPLTGNIRLLKTIVIVLGALIVVSLGVVIVTVYKRMSQMTAGDAAPTVAAEPAPVAPGTPFTAPLLDLPAGARLVDSAVGGGRLVLTIALADGRSELWLLDLANGRRLGIVTLVPSAGD